LILGVLSVVGAVNALAKPNHDRSWHLRPWWLFAMLTAELIPLRFAVRLGLVMGFTALGALDHTAGMIGLWLVVASWLGHLWLLTRAVRARSAMRKSISRPHTGGAARAPAMWPRILAGNPYPVPRDIERIENLEYMPGYALDIYARPGGGSRPAILQVHGGSWRGGNRRQQARPLLHNMARRGWIGVAPSYPLVPDATIEDQILALKRAIVWLRKDGRAFGVDPSFIAITGGSAGAHLASVVALTGNRPDYQPGLERSDTSIQAAVALYGIYDLLNRNHTRDDWPIVTKLMRSTRREDEQRYRAYSPLDLVSNAAPPFLVIHGTHDSVVSLAESEQLVTALQSVSPTTVDFAHIPGATHGFDTLYSIRSQLVVNGVATFLESARDGDG